ncbi:MAG: hypothetical protein A3D10_03900 [Omnitrophica WOR_2 bacterium RIFCSPHIGHO2_02_FULL_48_11]|nr:MAG: hypothetical protein A3D10_03900 [Omnitrophica WOR_2 bacterium RIFCSPHIGHO2_02_FULL_48_11]
MITNKILPHLSKAYPLQRFLLISLFLLFIFIPNAFASSYGPNRVTLIGSAQNTFGEYFKLVTNTLKLKPITAPSCIGNDGTLYLNALTNEIEICSGGTTKKFQPWTQTGNIVSLTDTAAKIVNQGTAYGTNNGLTINGGSLVVVDSVDPPTPVVVMGRGHAGAIINTSLSAYRFGRNVLIGSLHTSTSDTFIVGGEIVVDPAAVGSSVLGGYNHFMIGPAGVIGGGDRNSVGGNYGAVVGGNLNTADGTGAIVGGGYLNRATADYAGVFSGNTNTASAVTSFVGGGDHNEANSNNSTIAGGTNNIIHAFAADTTIAGGFNNRGNGPWSFIGGGHANTAGTVGLIFADGNSYAVVAGGENNIASGHYAAILGGQGNEATNAHSVALGGQNAKAKAPGSLVFGKNLTIDVAASNSIAIGNDAVGVTVTAPNVITFPGLNVGMGVTNPGVRLAVNGAAKIGPGAAYYASSSPTFLVIFRATITDNGGAILTGDPGVSVTKLGTGEYQVSYPDISNVNVVATAIGIDPLVATLENIDTSSCIVYLHLDKARTDGGFTIMISGTPPAALPLL